MFFFSKTKFKKAVTQQEHKKLFRAVTMKFLKAVNIIFIFIIFLKFIINDKG